MATKSQRLAQLLFTNRRDEEGFWPWLSKGRPTSQKNGNKFLLGCILDYQMPAEIAWENARRVAEDIFGNPNDLWHQISGVPLSKWNMKWEEYKLHRYL